MHHKNVRRIVLAPATFTLLADKTRCHIFSQADMFHLHSFILITYHKVFTNFCQPQCDMATDLALARKGIPPIVRQQWWINRNFDSFDSLWYHRSQTLTFSLSPGRASMVWCCASTIFGLLGVFCSFDLAFVSVVNKPNLLHHAQKTAGMTSDSRCVYLFAFLAFHGASIFTSGCNLPWCSV